MAAATRAVLGHLLEVGERLDQVLRLHVGEPEGADARGVDDPAVAVGQLEEIGAGRGVAPAAGDRIHDADLAVGVRHEGVDECRLADAAVADHDARAAAQPVAELDQVARAVALELGDHPGHAERSIGREQGLGVGQVGLGHAEQGRHARVVRRHQGAVDQARARLGVGQGGHDDELVGVGDDHPLDRVVVVGGAPQGCAALDHLDDAGERPVVAGRVADDPDVVAHDHALAAEGARLHRHHPVAVEQQGEAPAVDGDDAPEHGVVVGRPVLGAGAGASAGSLVVLVVLVGVATAHRGTPTASVQAAAKSGKVFDVVSTSSTSTPSTTRPRITPAWAIR